MMHPKAHPAAHWLDRLLGHWILAAAIILVAAALTYPQIDKYSISADAQHSYRIALNLLGGRYTPVDVLENLYASAPDQGVLYYLALHFWGKLAGNSLAASQLISLYCGLLSLAMVYRLARDFVSPEAGVFAASVLLCNAFYAFYYAHVRFYTLIVLLAATILWLYQRIATRRQQPKRRDYLALLLACYALVSTHAFGFLLYLTLSLHHLLFARKNRRWLLIMGTALLGVLLASPQLSVQLTAGLEMAVNGHGPRSDSIEAVLASWMTVISNGSPILPIVSLVGVVVGWRRKWLRGNPLLMLFPLLIVSIAVSHQVTGIISEGLMRYLQVGMPIVVGFFAAGVFALYNLRRWLGLLMLLMWLVAGLSFMRAADWELLIQGRTWAYTHPPWHLISRWILQQDEDLQLMRFKVWDTLLLKSKRQYEDVGILQHYYFDQHGIDMQNRTLLDFDGRIGDGENKLGTPGYWIMFQHGVTNPQTIDIVLETMSKYDYDLCGRQEFTADAAVYTFRWTSLRCDPEPKETFATDAGAYQHFGAVHDDARLLFAGLWQPATDAQPDAHNISFQLLDADWRSHAQIDLPVESLIDIHQPYFDLADLPAGDYRLMAIVYDAHTGERLAWQDNEDWIPEMQQLAEIAIPEPAASSS